MSLPKDDAAILSARWTEGVLLKRDVFSTVERGRFRDDAGEVDAVLRRLDQVPCVVVSARPPSVRARTPRAGAGARSRRRPEAALGRPARAGARLHRRRRAASGQAAWRSRLFPLRQAGAAQAASRRHLPQRSRQGAELAARQRRPRLCDRFPAGRLLQDAQPPVPDRGLRGSAAPAEAQAQLCAARR